LFFNTLLNNRYRALTSGRMRYIDPDSHYTLLKAVFGKKQYGHSSGGSSP
jgi:hypothetical protein